MLVFETIDTHCLLRENILNLNCLVLIILLQKLLNDDQHGDDADDIFAHSFEAKTYIHTY